ncbi:hypothetical protein [Miniphocaeibacter massiliensis]|uniref:hypothetical protein n=1 Tax=Miniphocaeibacter massiliensis TaxID=2041841 RepID=UPI000C0785DE|nr:hypothetical protein [Miniphocaeibacter massiliensis]
MKKKLFLLTIIIVLILSFTACNKNSKDETKEETSTTVAVTETTTEPITEATTSEEPSESSSNFNSNELYNEELYQKFLKIEEGMTKSEVDSILGVESSPAVSMNINGEKSVGAYNYETNRPIATLTVFFSSDKVSGKTQLGLVKDTVVTSSQAKKVKEGMKIEEVFKILGSGDLTSEDYNRNGTSASYSYKVDSSNLLTINTKNGIVENISNINMDQYNTFKN